MSSERENWTPSWKVNLTQKFNKASHKMHSNQTKLNFDDQLQQRLNFIPIQRQQLTINIKNQQLSTNKKDKGIKGEQTKQILNNQMSQQKNYRNRMQQQNRSDLKGNIQSRIEKLRFDSLEKNKQDLYYSQLFTDQKVAKLFTKYFGSKQSIQLQQFVNMCHQQLLSEKQCPPSQREDLIEQCRSLFCTTDDNLISLNAVQMLTKKTDLKLIMVEAVMNVKYEKKKNNLQRHYEQILQHIVEQQENIRREEEKIKQRQEKLEKKKAKIQTQQKQFRKKQLQLKAQQKQLIDKEKNIRNILQDKYTRMLQQFTSQCDKHLKEIDKRANGFERNARNKMELLEKRHNDYLKAVVGGQRKKEGTDELGSLHKHNNQLILLRSKLRKAQKELQVLLVKKSKQWEQLESESNSLLKANTVLQAKLQKSKERVKELSQILAKTNLQLSNTHEQLLRTQQQLPRLSQRISELEEQLLENEHNNNKPVSAQQHPNSLRPKTFTFRKQQKPPHQNQQIQQKQLNSQLQLLIYNFNQLIHYFMQGFSTYHHQLTPTVKIEEILLTLTHQILTPFSSIFWTAIRHSITHISSIVQFVIKLFLAKFSFLKFQSISNSNQSQNYLNQLEDFTQTISSSHLNQHLNKVNQNSIQQKLKTSSFFISQYYINQALEERLNLYLVMLMLGIDQTFNFKSNKIQPVIKHILSLILSLDNKKLPFQSKTNIINTFYDSELMAFLFWKYMSYSTATYQASLFMDVLIEISNLQNQINDFSNNNLLFKSMYALENYKYLTNFLILNFTDKNLQKNNKQLRQTLEKVSIILQRFCYFSKGKVTISEEDAKRLKKIMKQIKKNEQFNDSMFKANMKSILQTIFQNKDELSQY